MTTAKPQPTATLRALRYLASVGRAGIDAGSVGCATWPDGPPGGGKGASTSGGGYYAAQMLLGRLKKAGLVEYAPSEGASRWRLSVKGIIEVHKMPDAPVMKTRSGGAIVSSSDPCTCGCAPEEHGRDPEYPGSTSCTNCEDCVAYEADPEDS